jgi:hypothetical protein
VCVCVRVCVWSSGAGCIIPTGLHPAAGMRCNATRRTPAHVRRHARAPTRRWRSPQTPRRAAAAPTAQVFARVCVCVCACARACGVWALCSCVCGAAAHLPNFHGRSHTLVVPPPPTTHTTAHGITHNRLAQTWPRRSTCPFST